MNRVDTEKLSRYLDGNLEFDTAVEVAEQIEKDITVQRELIQLLKSDCLLKAYGQSLQSENLASAPEADSFSRAKKGKIVEGNFFKPFMQIAIVMVMFLGGFFTAQLNSSKTIPQSTIFPEVPTALVEKVNQVLEYEKSGTIYSWNSQDETISATITPVKTYRDDAGQYYRYYMIDIDQDGRKKQLKGVAHREGKSEWRTDSISTYLL